MTDAPNDVQVVRLQHSKQHPVRLSYFYGFTGFKDKDDPTKIGYPVHFIIPPTHPAVPQIVAGMKAAALSMWKDQSAAMYESMKAQHKLCLKEGSIMKPGEDVYAGQLFVSANAKKRFTIVAPDRTPITDSGHPFAPYSGCFANGIVQIWPQNNSWGKRINAQPMGVQFAEHGEPLGGGRVANPDDFGVVSVAGADGAAPAAAGAASGLF